MQISPSQSMQISPSNPGTPINPMQFIKTMNKKTKRVGIGVGDGGGGTSALAAVDQSWTMGGLDNDDGTNTGRIREPEEDRRGAQVSLKGHGRLNTKNKKTKQKQTRINTNKRTKGRPWNTTDLPAAPPRDPANSRPATGIDRGGGESRGGRSSQGGKRKKQTKTTQYTPSQCQSI